MWPSIACTIDVRMACTFGFASCGPCGFTLTSSMVSSVKLHYVMMDRTSRGRARTAITRAADADLARAILPLKAIGPALRDTIRGPGNIPEQPVQDAIGGVVHERICIVEGQDET